MPAKNKIQAIGILRRSVFGSNDENYYSMLKSYGVKSCKDLSDKKASKFIAQLHQLEGTSKRAKYYKGKGKRGMQKRLTNEQAERIGLLKSLLGWSDAGIYSFIERQTKRPTGPEMLRNYEAVKVIIGMERIYSSNTGIDYKTINTMNNTDIIKLIGENNKAKKAN